MRECNVVHIALFPSRVEARQHRYDRYLHLSLACTVVEPRLLQAPRSSVRFKRIVAVPTWRHDIYLVSFLLDTCTLISS